ncbi:hypothetical protein V2G26_009726 [Clonostachys chloroleuca]
MAGHAENTPFLKEEEGRGDPHIILAEAASVRFWGKGGKETLPALHNMFSLLKILKEFILSCAISLYDITCYLSCAGCDSSLLKWLLTVQCKCLPVPWIPGYLLIQLTMDAKFSAFSPGWLVLSHWNNAFTLDRKELSPPSPTHPRLTLLSGNSCFSMKKRSEAAGM